MSKCGEKQNSQHHTIKTEKRNILVSKKQNKKNTESHFIKDACRNKTYIQLQNLSPKINSKPIDEKVKAIKKNKGIIKHLLKIANFLIFFFFYIS